MKKVIFLMFFAWSINSYSNPRIDIVSNSKYSDTEQIWIVFHDIEWSKNGYSIYKDGKFKFNLIVDEGFVIMRSFEGKYSFASTT